MSVSEEAVSGETNRRHLERPQPGDYWNEMMCPNLVVLGVNARGILVCDGTKAVDKDHWALDFAQVRTLDLDELRKAVRCCYCYPRFHASVVDSYAEYLGVGCSGTMTAPTEEQPPSST